MFDSPSHHHHDILLRIEVDDDLQQLLPSQSSLEDHELKNRLKTDLFSYKPEKPVWTGFIGF
jgi:hypothetical protein